MKIRNVEINNRKNEFTVTTWSGSVYVFPYSKADPYPKPDNRIKKLFVDKEFAREAFTYLLESGEEGSIHLEQILEQILEYNYDPTYYAELLIYKLSLEARQRVEKSETLPLSNLWSAHLLVKPQQLRQRSILGNIRIPPVRPGHGIIQVAVSV